MVESCGTFLKQGDNDHHPEFLGEFPIELCRRTGNGLCQVEVVHIFCLTEVQRVVQLLKHNQFSSSFGEVLDTFCQSQQIILCVSSILLLQESYLHFSHSKL